MVVKICKVSLDLCRGESCAATPWCCWNVGSRSSLADDSRTQSFDMASRMLIGLLSCQRTRLSLVSMPILRRYWKQSCICLKQHVAYHVVRIGKLINTEIG